MPGARAPARRPGAGSRSPARCVLWKSCGERRGGLAGSCRRPTRARRHEPAGWSLTVTAAPLHGFRFRPGGYAEGERAGRIVIGRIDHDLVLAGLREGRREPGVTVAARVVVLEIAAGLDAGPAQEQVGVEVVGLEIDRDRLADASLNRPGLRIRAVAPEEHVAARERAFFTLADVD